MVLSLSHRSDEARQPRHALFVYVAPTGARGDSYCDQPRPAPNVENARRKGGSFEGDPRSAAKPHAPRRQFEKLRPLELYAGEAGRHEEVERFCSHIAQQKAVEIDTG